MAKTFAQMQLQAIADALGDTSEGLTGSEIHHLLMTCVLPAWQIIEVLKMPALMALRQPEIARFEEQRKNLMAKHRSTESKAERAEPPPLLPATQTPLTKRISRVY